MNRITINVAKSIYPSECVIKAAYVFLEKAYILVDENEKYWIISLESKCEDADMNCLKGEFQNELLSQVIRINVYKQTKNIREMLMARAISTTLIDRNESYIEKNEETSQIDENEFKKILTDWFDSNGNEHGN